MHLKITTRTGAVDTNLSHILRASWFAMELFEAAGLERAIANEEDYQYVKHLQRDVKGFEKHGIEEDREATACSSAERRQG